MNISCSFVLARSSSGNASSFAESPNQKVFIMPMELASLAGTLGGIGQIAAAALGGNLARGAIPQVAVEALGKNAVEARLRRLCPTAPS